MLYSHISKIKQMFSTTEGHPNYPIKFLAHDNVSLGLLTQGVIITIHTANRNWNLGFRAMRHTNRSGYPTNAVGNRHEGILPFDVLLSCEDDIQTDEVLSERRLSLYKVVDAEVLLLKTVSTSDRNVQQKLERRRKVASNCAEIYLKYIDAEKRLYLSYLDDRELSTHQFYEFSEMLYLFRIFTLGELDPAILKPQVQPYFIHENPGKSIRIGNLIIREGDMFNADPTLNADVMIVPASDEGTVSPGYHARIKSLEVSQPKPSPAGTLRLLRNSRKEGIYLAYTFSVERNASSVEIITQICWEINELIEHRDQIGEPILGINMPLLGTGAGGLDPQRVLPVYNSVLNAKLHDVPIIVSIQSPEVYRHLLQAQQRHSVELVHEFQQDVPKMVMRLQERLDLELSVSNYQVNASGDLISLDLENRILGKNVSFLIELTSLVGLSLNHSQLDNTDFLANMPQLKYLYMRATGLKNCHFLSFLPNLLNLDLSQNDSLALKDIAPHLSIVRKLALVHNNLTDIKLLRELTDLESLDLSHNQIADLRPLTALKKLTSLILPGNVITDLQPLHFLHSLRYLDVSSNWISEIRSNLIDGSIEFLRIDQNPFAERNELVLKEGENHLTTVRNFLLRQSEQNQTLIKLPVKVLLMGNHASGKTSLLRYIMDEKLAKSVSSTHIIQIERYYDRKSPALPVAIFYDFGGQDYYHGIYRAFLSGGAVNLILWNPENNVNQKRIDSKGRKTQDFKLDYWMAQKQYLEKEKYSGEIAPVLLIQTHADEQGKAGHSLNCKDHGVINEFLVCLSGKPQKVADYTLDVQKKSLKYLRSSINSVIRENQVEREVPQWFVEFLIYIINKGEKADHKPVKVKNLLPYYQREVSGKLELLKDDLDQLFCKGLILYYKKEMPNLVWLNPVAVVNYVHDHILRPDFIAKYNGLVPKNEFKQDKELIDMLLMQKVIFLHEPSGEYIIPNFLDLAENRSNEFELYTFGLGDPLFTLKFKNFLPFGLINQVICFFGELPEEKKFWRDRLIFTLERKAKVMISIDFQSLEIKVHAAFHKGVERIFEEQVKKYLFYGIVGLYWDLDLLSFENFIAYQNGSLKEESYGLDDPMLNKLWATTNFYANDNCRPMDLMISLNEKDFVHYTDLCKQSDSVMISSYLRNDDGELGTESRPIPVYPFQAFSTNELKRRKNVAISYSKKDLEMVTKFKDYLKPLYDDELIGHPWYCTELIAGTEWDEEIKRKFDEADIIFFMISENLMVTNYVLDNEIKNAIDKYDKGGKIKIVPIVLVPYHFQRKGTYNLGRFSALPYTLRPVTMFENQLEAWYMISESIRIMIEKDWDPGRTDALPPEITALYEKTIRRNKGKA